MSQCGGLETPTDDRAAVISRPSRCPGKPSTTAAADRSVREPIVNWSNWPDYIDVSDDALSHPTLTAFTAATGITVHYTEDYYDNEEFYTEVAPQLAAGQGRLAELRSQ